MSSIQSVAGQPVSPPLSKPTHHGVPPSSTIWSLSAIRSSQVVGHLVAGGVEVVLRVPDHALEVDVGRQAVVLAVVLAEGHERLAEQVVQLVDVEAQVLERHDVARLGQVGDGAGLRHGGDVERAALGPDLELLLEVADRARPRRRSRPRR